MGSTDGSSTDYGSSDFDSDTGSRVSSMSATSANEEHFMIDHEPMQAGDTEVDLSAFHDVCRKILAKPLPPNASTGKTDIFFDYFLSHLAFCCILRIIDSII